MPIWLILYYAGICGFVPDWQIDIDWHGLPSLISSCQCSANPPIPCQSYANPDPILDWRCLVNPRKSRSILCNSNVNSTPIEAQTLNSSASLARQSIANQGQSIAVPVPIRCQFIANRISTHCQSDANPVPILWKSEASHSDVNAKLTPPICSI